MFDINNFIIDRIVRGVMTSTATGEVMYSINQIEDPSLKVTADEKTAVDALGSTIATFQNGKNAEFSASNSLFDLSLLASQMGTDKKIATSSVKLNVPIFETIDVAGTALETHVLQFAPVTAPTYIYGLNGDSTLGTKYTVSTDPSATQFKYTAATHTITLPTGLKAGSQIFVMYDYASENANIVTASATEFPKAGKFVMEVLGCDVCDPTTLIYAYVVFPNAKLDSNVDITFSTDGKHPFSLKAQQNYCSKEKELFKIIIPQLD